MEPLSGRTYSPSLTVKRSQESGPLVEPQAPTAESKRPKLDAEAEHDSAISNIFSERAPQGVVQPQKIAVERPKPKYKGKDRRRGTRREDSELRKSDEPKAPRLPKRACALLIGFCGADYSGMQFQLGQQHVRTIEGTLFDALVRVGAVSKDNADNPTKVSFSRAARTDAGVHAAGNLVSLKLIQNIPGVPDIVARINEDLPPEIRLWGVHRVNNGFNARMSCDSRKYTYFFPSYIMIPPKPGSGLHQDLTRNGTELPPHPFWTGMDPELDSESELRLKRTYRMPPDVLDSLRSTARKFLGNHNFHNFTVGREFRDRSCARYMKDIIVADPVVYGNTEWVSVMFHGQSFMLHQRKMMSALVLTCRTGSPPEIIDELYGPRKISLPKMPALGLLLEYPIFEVYNKRVEPVNEKLETSDPGYRPPIDFEVHRERIDKFKTEYIYPSMREIEDEEGVFDAWLYTIDTYSGDDLLWLNSKGIIPAAAVIHKGVHRVNFFKERKRFNATGRSGAATGQHLLVADEEAEEDEDEVLDKAKLDDMDG